jgi:hypothetical protein
MVLAWLATLFSSGGTGVMVLTVIFWCIQLHQLLPVAAIRADVRLCMPCIKFDVEVGPAIPA